MSINDWYEPEYWIYYTTQSVDSTISVTAIDEKKNVVNAGAIGSYIGANNKQSKNLTLTFTYTEPYTNATANIDKTFTIVQSGKPGDETIIFEVTPSNVILCKFKRNCIRL
jgi:ferredoxin-fold anticodon binding domain-containing protein